MITIRRREFAPEALELIAARFGALSEPSRLHILHELRKGETSVGALASETGLTQANTSRHLAILFDTGLVARRKSGLTVYYRVSDASVVTLCELACSSVRDRSAADAVPSETPGRSGVSG